MGLRDFIRKQFVDVIQWTEDEPGILAYRFPMQDMEIQMGGQLTVRESQMAMFVNEGKVADVFGPGLHRLETKNLPVLTNLMHWDKMFESPFKSDVYFFSTRTQLNQKWGTTQPVTIREKEFGAVRLRGFGTYAYRIANPLVFHQKVSGTRDIYRTTDLEGQLRNLAVSRMGDTFASSDIPFLDMAANQVMLGQKIAEQLQPAFTDLGLALEQFVVENLSLPEELQKRLDERIGMGMVGDMNRYVQFQTGQAIPEAAKNPGGAAGAGVGLGAGIGMGQAMASAMTPGGKSGGGAPPTPSPSQQADGQTAGTAAGGATKFCIHCGKSVARNAKFCAECGKPQS